MAGRLNILQNKTPVLTDTLTNAKNLNVKIPGRLNELNNSASTTTPTAGRLNKSAVLSTPQPKTAKLPTFLGGGQYNVGDQGSLITTPRDYAGVEAPGQYREHIFPVALGGTSNTDNIKVYGKDLGSKKSAYENEIIKQYKDKKISLPEARGLVLKKYRELTGLDPKQGVMANLLPAIGEMITNPLKTVKQSVDVLKGVREKIIKVVEPTPEDITYAKEHHGLTSQGQILVKNSSSKTGYTYVDPMAVGTLKDVGKEGLDAVGKQLLRNIQNFNPEKYVIEQVAKQEAARVAEQPGVLGTIGNFYKEVKTKLVDFNAPIEDVLNKNLKENKITLKPTEHITNQIDRVLKTPGIAEQFAKRNGLISVIENVDNLNNLDQYMIAKQAKTVEANGIKTGRNLAKDELLINAFKDKYEPYAQQVNQYSQKLLDYSVDSGLVSKELAQNLKQKYPEYVPINRIFNELEKGQQFDSKAVASLSKQTVVQKLVGSEREIKSPVASLLAKTNDAIKQGEKNKAASLLAGYKDLPGNPFQLRELQSGEKALHTISYLDNGVKRTFETTPDIVNAAKALNVQQLGILGKIFATPVRIAKVGITGINLPFIASNIAKDQVTGFINADKAFKTSIANPYNFIKSLFSAVGHDDLYQEMINAGAGGTSLILPEIRFGQPSKE